MIAVWNNEAKNHWFICVNTIKSCFVLAVIQFSHGNMAFVVMVLKARIKKARGRVELLKIAYLRVCMMCYVMR